MAYVTNAERIGIQKGIEHNTRELAIKMLQEGIEMDMIARITGLSIEQLQKLQSEITQPNTQA